MNVVIFGAGAIGSLFGAFLSKQNNTFLIGRKNHVDIIKRNGLKISGITNMKIQVDCSNTVDEICFKPDLLILTVKSYDTEDAIKEIKSIIAKDTIVLSLQNGLDNIEKIEQIIGKKHIIGGITTHGAFFSEPGVINHTGVGATVLGEIDGRKTERLERIVSMFNEVGIKTEYTLQIFKEIWIKAVINSSINPLTSYFDCKNGYLLSNPILEKIVELVCKESTLVANCSKIDVSYEDMIKKTKDVIRWTSENYSSMLQSLKRGKRTEIASINGKIVEIGKNNGLDVSLNDMLIYLVESKICEKV
jgi:2-dehydropantoate 2-reductase